MLFNPFQPSVAFHIETSNLFCFELSISRDQQSIKFFKKTSHIEFKKKQKRSGTSLSTSFFAWLLTKMFLLLYSVTWPNFIVWLPLLREILSNTFNVIASQVVKSSFEINLIFLIKRFLLHDQKVKTKD